MFNHSKIQSVLTDKEWQIVKGIFNSKTGELRASRPPVDKKTVKVSADNFMGYTHIYSTDKGRQRAATAYIWRMVRFYTGLDSSMPVTAEFWLEGTSKQSRKTAKQLDEIVDKIMSTVELKYQQGLIQWGKALGML